MSCAEWEEVQAFSSAARVYPSRRPRQSEIATALIPVNWNRLERCVRSRCCCSCAQDCWAAHVFWCRVSFWPLSMAADMSRFAKGTDSIPSLDLGHSVAKQNSTILMERGLVGMVLGLCPSPKIVLEWVSKNWSEQVLSTFYFLLWYGFFCFHFWNYWRWRFVLQIWTILHGFQGIVSFPLDPRI